MICLGHIFDERPQVAPSHPCHYTAPPRGSWVVRVDDPPLGHDWGNSFAVDPNGFGWVLLADLPVWVPTGSYFELSLSGHPLLVSSFEGVRNYVMK